MRERRDEGACKIKMQGRKGICWWKFKTNEPVSGRPTFFIRRALQFMRPIIHFNRELHGGRNKIQDVPINRDLTLEGNAQLLAGNAAPKDLLIFGKVVPEELRPLREQRLKLE